MSAPRVYSVGHSTRRLEDFLWLLAAWRVRRLVDVRRFPVSRRHPHFKREALESACARNAIDYVWMGDALGGFRDGGYEPHMATPEFQDAIARLEELARDRATAFLCAEKEPARCHRRFIAQALERRGWHVGHILEEASAVPEGAQCELW